MILRLLYIIPTFLASSGLDDFVLWDHLDIPDDTPPELLPQGPASDDDLFSALVHEGGLYPSVSSRGRDRTAPTLRQLTSINPFLIPEIALRAKLDARHDAYTPQIVYDSRIESTPIGNITLGRLITQKFSHIDFEIVEHPNMIIRYAHDCVGMPFTPLIHPLLYDSIFSKEAYLADVAPEPYFVSPPAILPNVRGSRKLAFRIDDQFYYSCFFAEGTVRYSLIEKTQQSLRSFIASEPGGKLDFWFTMELGKTLVSMVRALHERNITHGDITVESWRVNRLENDEFKMNLVNFGFASDIDENGFARYPARKDIRSPFSIALSPRELEGNVPVGVYDDLFRVVETLASIVQNVTIYRYVLNERFINGTLLEWKKSGNLFGDLTTIVDASLLYEVQRRIDTILGLVRPNGAIELGRPPQYDTLIQMLDEIVLLTGPVAPTTTTTTNIPRVAVVLEPLVIVESREDIGSSQTPAPNPSPSNIENQRPVQLPSRKRRRPEDA